MSGEWKFTIRFPREVKELITVAARSRGLSVSAYIRAVVLEAARKDVKRYRSLRIKAVSQVS